MVELVPGSLQPQLCKERSSQDEGRGRRMERLFSVENGPFREENSAMRAFLEFSSHRPWAHPDEGDVPVFHELAFSLREKDRRAHVKTDGRSSLFLLF